MLYLLRFTLRAMPGPAIKLLLGDYCRKVIIDRL